VRPTATSVTSRRTRRPGRPAPRRSLSWARASQLPPLSKEQAETDADFGTAVIGARANREPEPGESVTSETCHTFRRSTAGSRGIRAAGQHLRQFLPDFLTGGLFLRLPARLLDLLDQRAGPRAHGEADAAGIERTRSEALGRHHLQEVVMVEGI